MIDLSDSRALSSLNTDTIDGEFIGKAIGIWDDICVAQDSDDLLMCTLTPDDAAYSCKSSAAASVEAIHKAAYGFRHVNALHRWYVSKAIKIHTEPLSSDWTEVEEETGHMIYRALSFDPPEEAPIPSQPPLPSVTAGKIVYPAVRENVTPTPGVDEYGNEYEDDVRISAGTELFGSCYIGRGTELNNVTVYRGTRIGRYCSIGRGAKIGASNHPMGGITSSLRHHAISATITFVGAELGHDVWVGANAVIIAGVKVGHGAVIGAGTVVTKDVRPFAIVVGVPGKEIRRRFPDQICENIVDSKWWNLPADLFYKLPADNIEKALQYIAQATDPGKIPSGGGNDGTRSEFTATAASEGLHHLSVSRRALTQTQWLARAIGTQINSIARGAARILGRPKH